MNELFLKIINMSISASWLVLAVLILRLVLKKAPKWVNVLFWGIVAIRLICPFSFESALSLIPSAETFPERIISGPSFDVQTGIAPVDNRINDYLEDRYFEGVTVPANNGNNVMTILTIVWIIGILLLIAYTIISYRRLHREIDTAVRYKENIFQSENVSSPFVLGIIKPRIYLPFNMNGQDLEHVIAHEQAHIHRRDHWWKPLGFLLLTIHWFNPLMWLAYVLLCRDIELACDEKVIKELGNEQRADYTQALVACSVGRRIIAACPLAFGEVGVKERVKSVMNYKKPAFWVIVLAVIACVVVAVCFLTNPKQDSYTLRIVVPAGSTEEIVYQEDFVYSDEEISPTGNKITISAGEGLGDTEVVLKPIEVKEENAYEPTYLTPGMPVEMDVEKGAWFKVGVNIQNPTDEDIIVYVEVENVEVRISEKSDTVRKWFDYLDAPSEMPSDGRLEINLPAFPDVTFRWYPEKMEAVTDEGITPLYTGMPIWNTYFCDLTGDGLPDLCSTYTLGSGIIDSRIIIYDYANGSSYELIDRGNHDFTLRFDEENGRLWVDKKVYNSDELVSSGYLVFADGCLQIAEDSSDSLDAAISNAILDHYRRDEPNGLIHVESHVLLANETISGTPQLGADNHMEKTTVYLLVFHEKYSTYGGELESVGGSYVPAALTFTISDSGEYILEEYWEPRDGGYYVDDVRDKFPGSSADDALNDQAYIEDLEAQNYRKALSYMNSTGSLDVRIEELLVEICSSSGTYASELEKHLEAHKAEYQELLGYGEYTLRYCFSEFLQSGQTDLRGQIMALACQDIMLAWGEGYAIDQDPITGQDWFDEFRENAESLSNQFSREDLEKSFPGSFLLLQLIENTRATEDAQH